MPRQTSTESIDLFSAIITAVIVREGGRSSSHHRRDIFI
jgi:hypothetical protein